MSGARLSRSPMILHLDAVGVELGEIVADEPLEQPHQHRHFLWRAAPVFRRKAVDGQELHVVLDRRANGPADRLDAPPMAFEPRQPARLRPAAVAVHDDRDVGRLSQRSGIKSGAGIMHDGLGQWRDRLDLHDFLFLSGEGGVDLMDGLIGRLLHFRLLMLFVVLADRVLLQELL